MTVDQIAEELARIAATSTSYRDTLTRTRQLIGYPFHRGSSSAAYQTLRTEQEDTK